MKPSASLTIYIASSFRSLHAVHLLRDALTERGHTVMDWSKLAPPLPADMLPEERRAALDSDERGNIFRFCTHACGGVADLVIYLGPAGQDSACEVGMATLSCPVCLFYFASICERVLRLAQNLTVPYRRGHFPLHCLRRNHHLPLCQAPRFIRAGWEPSDAAPPCGTLGATLLAFRASHFSGTISDS